MLKELFISNLAIIEKTNIEFSSGLNVITGETGSGKSIIIDALELLLCSRARKDIVGVYADKAIVEAIYDIDKDHATLLDKVFDLNLSNNENTLIATREISKDGKSIFRINNRPIPISMGKKIMTSIVNLHTQHSNDVLQNKANYIDIVDAFSPKLIKSKENLAKYFDEKKKIESELFSLDIDDAELERRIDVLNYQISEIDELDLENLDVDKLDLEYKKLANAAEISKLVLKIKSIFSNEDYDNNSINSLLSIISKDFSNLVGLDETQEEKYEQLLNIQAEIDDFEYELDSYYSNIEIDDLKLSQLNEKIEKLEILKRKYGKSIEDILLFKNKAIDELEQVNNKELIKEKLINKLNIVQNNLEKEAINISNLRKDLALQLEDKIIKELKRLNLKNIKFEVKFDKNETIGRNGFDDIDFYVSFNIGQPMSSLSSTASGGELSRFMLALKIVYAQYDSISTLIFDEIDTGISGVTAQVVGESLSSLSDNYQIILVTHLPQIAVQANHHYLLYKYIEKEKTKVKVRKILLDERINEIARLMGGANITDKILDSAKEQLDKFSKI